MPDAAGDHPGPSAVSLPAAIREAIVAQARAEYPNEACGLIVGDAPAADGGSALHYVPTRNRSRDTAVGHRARLRPPYGNDRSIARVIGAGRQAAAVDLTAAAPAQWRPGRDQKQPR